MEESSLSEKLDKIRSPKLQNQREVSLRLGVQDHAHPNLDSCGTKCDRRYFEGPEA
jgi:hypothetical protein